MRGTRLAALALAAISAAVVVAGCGGGGSGDASSGTDASLPTATTGAGHTNSTSNNPQPGGTYRVGVESSFNFSDAFDPTGEYTAEGWSFYTLLVRKLVTYPGAAGQEGNQIVPDLATDLGQISDDGLTYTFTLKDSIKFGPPLNREITSKDVAAAFNRIANPEIGSFGYPGYYTVITGFQDVIDGKAKTISGIETPDDKTIVFHLDRPAGDFLYRIAMPAAGPIPEEVTDCFTKGGDYGRFVISSGPYMIEGSDQLDISSCDSMNPISGYNPEKFLHLVRNPSYDPASDSPEVRSNYPDRFEFDINSNADDIFAQVRAGIIDDTLAGETGKQTKEYTENADLRDNLKLNPDDGIFYLNMNLTQPPFDDIHVRKAMNYITDKTGLIRAWGGSSAGEPATHILAPSLSPPELDGYDPYPSQDFAGDEAAAKEEMKQSRYDTNQDGICDAPECKDIVNIMGTTARDKGMIPVIESAAAEIGIEIKTRQVDDPFSIIFVPKSKLAFTGAEGWGKDYPDAYTFFLYLFDGRGITPEFSYNNALVGLTPKQAEKIGIDYPAGGVPSVDADIDACVAIADKTERLTCWGNLDKKLMEQVVPYVPFLWSNQSVIIADTVTSWAFDQATGNQAWVHVAVDPSKQQHG